MRYLLDTICLKLVSLTRSSLSSSHKEQILDLRLRMDALQKEYLRERQELSARLLHAIRSHEVCTDSATLSDLYPSSMTSSVGGGQGQSIMGSSLNEAAAQSLAAYSDAENMTSVTSSMTSVPLQFAAMLPALPQNCQYQIQVNPDGSQQFVQVAAAVIPPSAAAATVVSSTTSSASVPASASASTTTSSTHHPQHNSNNNNST
jgi:hypothetical protein